MVFGWAPLTPGSERASYFTILLSSSSLEKEQKNVEAKSFSSATVSRISVPEEEEIQRDQSSDLALHSHSTSTHTLAATKLDR